MREDVKRSLDTLFEHAKISENKPFTASTKKQRRNWLPGFAFIGIALLASIIFVPSMLQKDLSTRNGSSEEQIVDDEIFTYKGTYVGNASAVSHIVSYALGDVKSNGIELHTKEKPYGITLPLDVNMGEKMEIRVALYLFSLIQNLDYINFNIKNQGEIKLEKTILEEKYGLQFEQFENESQLMATMKAIYPETELTPKLQLVSEEGNKVLMEAITSAKVVKQDVPLNDVNYLLDMNSNRYIFWITDEKVGFINQSDVETVYEVEGDVAERLKNYVTSDFIAISGEVTMIGGNFIKVEQTDKIGNLGDETILLAHVDEPQKYRVGDLVTIYTKEITEQYPPAAMTTKVKQY